MCENLKNSLRGPLLAETCNIAVVVQYMQHLWNCFFEPNGRLAIHCWIFLDLCSLLMGWCWLLSHQNSEFALHPQLYGESPINSAQKHNEKGYSNEFSILISTKKRLWTLRIANIFSKESLVTFNSVVRKSRSWWFNVIEVKKLVSQHLEFSQFYAAFFAVFVYIHILWYSAKIGNGISVPHQNKIASNRNIRNSLVTFRRGPSFFSNNSFFDIREMFCSKTKGCFSATVGTTVAAARKVTPFTDESARVFVVERKING